MTTLPKETSEKIDSIHSTSLKKTVEIRNAHNGVFGYSQEDADGTSIQVAGLKKELETSFDELTKKFDQFSNNSTLQFNEKVASWDESYSSIHKDVEKLLPKALTAGLSAAYSDKKDDEIKTLDRLSLQFFISIGAMVLASLIPFGISIYLLFNGTELSDAITDIPRIVLAILPLYIPVLWLAYSSSKKANLSKRLIEEYTHKEVLSKTFEGLSRQIEGIENPEVSSELRIKLLYNILEISSENPGKLISNYNKSDHPLMDALDKSAQLASAIDSLSNIPGLSKVVRMLDKRKDKVLSDASDKVTDSLDVSDKG